MKPLIWVLPPGYKVHVKCKHVQGDDVPENCSFCLNHIFASVVTEVLVNTKNIIRIQIDDEKQDTTYSSPLLKLHLIDIECTHPVFLLLELLVILPFQ